MQSSNPVFRRAEGFNGQRTTSASGMSYPSRGAQTYADRASTQPAGRGYDSHGAGGYDTSVPTDRGPMTIDSVVQKTAMTLGLTTLVAAATWFLTPDLGVPGTTAGSLYLLAMVGAFGGFGLAMVNSFKRVVSPGLVLAYAGVEGLFVGAFSKVIEASFGGGLVIGAVMGTLAAVAGTLAAYKFFNIRVSPTFRKWVVGAMLGFVAVSMLDLVMSFFGSSFGFNGFGAMGLISSVIGLGLGVLMLILDFDFVERGIAAGLPERESWRAAFGLTVTIIWIYIEMLRILAILRGD
ncbi:MAG: Bax inhibitor-1/YccA family protein [Nocardioidaceae bacterium]